MNRPLHPDTVQALAEQRAEIEAYGQQIWQQVAIASQVLTMSQDELKERIAEGPREAFADVLHDLEHLLESSWPTIAGILITAEARAWQSRF